jgi:hypothetical protein
MHHDLNLRDRADNIKTLPENVARSKASAGKQGSNNRAVINQHLQHRFQPRDDMWKEKEDFEKKEGKGVCRKEMPFSSQYPGVLSKTPFTEKGWWRGSGCRP